MNDERRQAVLAELAEQLPKPLGPEEFTIRDFQQISLYSYEGARNVLRRKVENGELAMGKRHDERTGHKVNAYWRIAKDWENGLDERTPQAE